MATVETITPARRLPGPPELLPGQPDAVIDLQTDEGVALVGGEWRYADCAVREIDFVELGGPDAEDPLGPGTVPNRTYDVEPHAEAAGFDDSAWQVLAPADTQRRLPTGGCASTGTARRSRSPIESATSTSPAQPSSSRSS